LQFDDHYYSPNDEADILEVLFAQMIFFLNIIPHMYHKNLQAFTKKKWGMMKL